MACDCCELVQGSNCSAIKMGLQNNPCNCNQCTDCDRNMGPGPESRRSRNRMRLKGHFRYCTLALLLFCLISEALSSAAIFGGASDWDDWDEDAMYMRTARQKRAPQTVQSLKDVENLIPSNYSIHEPPPTAPGATRVTNISVIVMNVRDIKEISEELSLEMNLRMSWQDTRLNHLVDKSNSYLVLNPNLLDKLWHPDAFIDHVKSVAQPAVISKPASLRIYPNSIVRYSARLTVTVACSMDFNYYPADTQHCKVDMKSYAYTQKVLDLVWDKQKGIKLADNVTLPNFDIDVEEGDNTPTNTSSGSYAKVQFQVKLRRKLSYHLIQTYLPSALFIIVSWLSFLIPPESVPGRMACCMTTLLTLTAMFGAVRQNTPNVSYVKALDIWMVVCIVFVFLTLLEYTVVLKLKSLKPKKKKQQQQRNQQLLDTNTLTSIRSGHINHGHNGNAQHSIPTISYPSYGDFPTLQMRRKTLETSFNNQPLDPSHHHADNDANRRPDSALPPMSLPSAGGAMTGAKKEPEGPNKFELRAQRLEMVTSTVVPLLFIFFNFIYWPWLLHKSEYYSFTFVGNKGSER